MAYDGALKFDTKVDQSGFVGGISQLKSTAMAAIGAIGGAFATGAIAKALIGQIGLVEQYGSAINDQSQKIGITTQAYQELSYMMGQVGGNADMLQMGVKTLSSAVVDGNKGFEQLGISLDKARSMSQEDLFNTVIGQLAGMESGTLRTSLATDLFGRSASELAPLLNMGTDGIAKMRQEAQTYGLVMTNEAVAATDKFGDAQTLAQKSGEALRNAMIGKMMPALTDIALGFADIAKASTEAFNARGISGVVDVITDKFPIATAAVSGLTAAFVLLLIINTLNGAFTAFAATEALLTTATQFGTLAQWNELGALTAKQIVVAALTGKVGLATSAQWLFNAAISANPVMILVTAIGVLVGGVVLLTKNFDKLYPSIAETREELESLDKSLEESAKTFDTTLESVDKQRSSLDGTVEVLNELSKAYSGSGAEQLKMQSLVDSLNSKVEGLNLSFDKQTGKLSQNLDAINDQIDAQYDLAKATAASARFQELVSAQLDAQYLKRQAQVEFDKYHAADGTRNAGLDFGSGYFAAGQTELNLQKAAEGFDASSQALSEFDSFLKSIGIDLGLTSDATKEVVGTVEDVTEAVENAIIGGYEFSEGALTSIGMTADEVAGRLDNFTSAATNMFERISTESKIKVADMIANLEANAIAIEDWGDNIAYLGSKLPSDLLQPLIDAGPNEMAGVLNQLAGASDTELANLAAAFGNGGEEAKEAWLLSLGAGLEEENPLLGVLDGAEEAASESGAEFGKSLITAINQQDYSGATSSLTNAFKNSFQDASNSFHVFLDRVHFDLAYAVGGVRIDLAYLASEVKSALAKIPTQITIRVNVIYGSSGSVGGVGGAGGVVGGKPLITGGGVYAPITVQGVVQSDTQLANTITRNFGEVMYGRNS